MLTFKELIENGTLFDSHCHINHPVFTERLDEVVDNAIIEGVEAIVDVGYTPESNVRAVENAKKYPGKVMAAVGLHPDFFIPGSQNYATDYDEEWIKKSVEDLKQLITANSREIILIGECGLDFYWLEKADNSDEAKDKSKLLQEKLFRAQIELSLEFGLGLTIHHREATDQVIEILSEYDFPDSSSAPVILHSFTGDYAQYLRINELGFWVGINGIVTYSSAKLLWMMLTEQLKISNLQDLYLVRILLETDAPYLIPRGVKAKRNEPCYLSRIAAQVGVRF